MKIDIPCVLCKRIQPVETSPRIQDLYATKLVVTQRDILAEDPVELAGWRFIKPQNVPSYGNQAESLCCGPCHENRDSEIRCDKTIDLSPTGGTAESAV